MQTTGFHGKLALVHYDDVVTPDVVPFLHALARTKLLVCSLAVGNKIKTKLKFGINYIGKKKQRQRSNGEYYDRLISD